MAPPSTPPRHPSPARTARALAQPSPLAAGPEREQQREGQAQRGVVHSGADVQRARLPCHVARRHCRAAAGLKPTLYYYVKNKDEILLGA